MLPRIRQSLRLRANRIYTLLGGHYWFPHVPLAVLVGLGGLWMLHATFGWDWRPYFVAVLQGHFHVRLRLLPVVLIGGGLFTMGLALLWRSRLAWVMTLLLAIIGAVNTELVGHTHVPALIAYFSFVVVTLLFSWRQFDRSSVAASTLFAVTSVLMLLLYATFGSFYLGSQFTPPIKDLVTAFYYAMVTMSTVGYGDIDPKTSESRLFAISVIVLGVAVFATSLTAVIAPLVSHSLQRVINRKGKAMKRSGHFVVIGNTPLAENTSSELEKRNLPVTRILRETPEDGDLKDVDLVIGDPSMTSVLRQAGAHEAEAVLAMMADDSENAFVVLAVKELSGSARTIAAVNDTRHLNRVKLVQPDIVIAPQVMGGELTAMLLAREPITSEFVLQRVFQHGGSEPSSTA